MKYLMPKQGMPLSYEEDPDMDPLENLKNALTEYGFRLANEGESYMDFMVIEAIIKVRPFHWDHPVSYE